MDSLRISKSGSFPLKQMSETPNGVSTVLGVAHAKGRLFKKNRKTMMTAKDQRRMIYITFDLT